MILHITTASAWAQAQAGGTYRDPSLEHEGFIHCSTREQLAGTLARHFAGVADLVVLEIDPALLDAPVVYEDSYGSGTEFPHVYGPIPLAAVVATERPNTELGGGATG